MKKVCLFVLSLLLLLLSAEYSFAAVLTLEKIGALSTGGKMYSEWWYTGENPALSGKADPDVEVTVKVDDKSYVFDSGASGNWSVTPTNLTNGDRNVAITTDEGGSYSFKLHVGQNLPENLGGTGGSATQSTTSAPTTGSNQIIGILLASTAFITAFYFYNRNLKTSFEKNIISRI
ncbi:hypothetical protein A3F07_04200 [candidate division WWE3 bacterium RIFCSPHIGHO2_12_FULL_38_15]|uniref:Gram-positive cocci surface proteins LPxTG domain-containing protein n=1 Tax=candidate division WWE3 bacterium RIFCSPHIGHO2_02_FULL_38_14 TaxID=1802620 RepID=A0A1F4V800_UNCKA|nr:MAG: hypothetical protein A2793_01400 [candidate division WWE3 bacterium RIFCSPHIGHO2_01_FULL_38_45]OGC48497.1 MAG: hypothetical protein A3F07_04200 [candidate division WWE3 bacterium RIFCSPHIGHO2_12_FULL_38_15]OGC53342.1 MAG: hypothetical protein A3D91_02950 [candidate division WWE3 bacterium RIFCSPHIGHO2_02_FULL_38_14]OGC53846.1 MAG: hypothetical protein A3B64_00715 [candidate division WWE3 bacterium RIFCSPLOWO2_01_FULL_37_24]HLB51856.1 hypothetical protein [Patescibacteria group bacterium